MIRINVAINDSQYEALRDKAFKEHKSIAAIVREKLEANSLSAKVKQVHEIIHKESPISESIHNDSMTPLHNDIDPSIDADGNTRPFPSSVKRNCTFCHKPIYSEYAAKHYSDKHEDAQA